MKKINLIWLMMFFVLISTAFALNPDGSCPLSTICQINFIVLNSTGQQTGNANCDYNAVLTTDLSSLSSGTLGILDTNIGKIYTLNLTSTGQNTYNLYVNCTLEDFAPSYFMKEITFSNAFNITNINITANVSVNFNITEGNQSAKLTVGQCPNNNTAAFMLGLIYFLGIVFIYLGFKFAGAFGLLGSLIIFISSWYSVACNYMIAYISLAVGIIMFFIFAIRIGKGK